MKKTILFAGLFILLEQGAFAESEGGADYLKLTRENLPQAGQIVTACKNYLGFDMESSESYRRRTRLSALLPRAVVGYGRNDRTSQTWDYVDPVESGTVNGNPVQSSRFTVTGYEDMNTFNGSLSWNLSDLLIHRLDFSIENGKLSYDDQLHFLLNDLTKRYAELWSMLPEKEGEVFSRMQALKVMQNAGIIDAWSGGMLSRTLAAIDGQAVEIKNGSQTSDIVRELKDESGGDSGVIEVDDGQDDKTEKVGPSGF